VTGRIGPKAQLPLRTGYSQWCSSINPPPSIAVPVQPVVLIPVALFFFAAGYVTRDFLTALLPTCLAALCALALWRQTRDGGFTQATTVTALLLCGLGVVACLLGAALARERLGERPRPDWLRRALILALGMGDPGALGSAGGPSAASLQRVGSKLRVTVGCLALAALTDALWINKALYQDDPPPVATGLLVYAGLPALLVAALARGRARTRVGYAALYLACMVLVFSIWLVFRFASCGDACS
jgi:hypothetical protein